MTDDFLASYLVLQYIDEMALNILQSY